MYNRKIMEDLVDFIAQRDGIADKSRLSTLVEQAFGLRKEGKVFFGRWFAIRFCSAKKNFSNTVLALSVLQKYDDLPFIVCLVTPKRNHLFLANTTFLKKVSHSSQELRKDNVRGSFNGSDIMRDFEGVENTPEHFEFLFNAHENYTFEENLDRLVEATNHIAPIGKRFVPSPSQTQCIYDSVRRAVAFMDSSAYTKLNQDLNDRVRAVQSSIAIASSIDNVNQRGRVIEYLITAEDDDVKATLIARLCNGEPLPEIYTADQLGDYSRTFPKYRTETDIKTKVLCRCSNPKGYNVDKLLAFLAEEDSVYLVYIVAIDENGGVQTRLCTIFNRQLLSSTRIIRHCAGRNSRGATLYDGRALEEIIEDFDPAIDQEAALEFLQACIGV